MLKELKKNKKGFTLAELLIVVAIIAVLVAISIPIFTSQLEKSRDAVTIANLRSAYAEASAAALTGSSDDANVTVDNAFKDGVGKISVADVAIKSTDDNYGNGATELPFTVTAVAGVANKTATVEFDFPSNGGKPTATITINK